MSMSFMGLDMTHTDELLLLLCECTYQKKIQAYDDNTTVYFLERLIRSNKILSLYSFHEEKHHLKTEFGFFI